MAARARHEEMVWLRSGVEDMALEIGPERWSRDRDVAHLPALRGDRQAPALIVEVLDLDRSQCTLAQAVVEQQAQSDPIAARVLLRDDCSALVV